MCCAFAFYILPISVPDIFSLCFTPLSPACTIKPLLHLCIFRPTCLYFDIVIFSCHALGRLSFACLACQLLPCCLPAYACHLLWYIMFFSAMPGLLSKKKKVTDSEIRQNSEQTDTPSFLHLQQRAFLLSPLLICVTLFHFCLCLAYEEKTTCRNNLLYSVFDMPHRHGVPSVPILCRACCHHFFSGLGDWQAGLPACLCCLSWPSILSYASPFCYCIILSS